MYDPRTHTNKKTDGNPILYRVSGVGGSRDTKGHSALCRRDMNGPPTPVGGIRDAKEGLAFRRQDVKQIALCTGRDFRPCAKLRHCDRIVLISTIIKSPVRGLRLP